MRCVLVACLVVGGIGTGSLAPLASTAHETPLCRLVYVPRVCDQK